MRESPDGLEHENVPQNLFQCDLALKFFHLDGALTNRMAYRVGQFINNSFAGHASYFLEKNEHEVPQGS